MLLLSFVGAVVTERVEATLLVGVLSVFIISRNFLIRIVNSLMATLTIIYVYYV